MRFPLPPGERPPWRSWVFVLALTLLLYFAKEFYPLSHFPMYSRPEPEATLVYVTDGAGEPIAFRTVFGYGAANAKKSFNKMLDRVAAESGRRFFSATAEDKAAAGDSLLRYLHERRREEAWAERAPGELRLYLRTLRRSGSAVEETDELVATLTVP